MRDAGDQYVQGMIADTADDVRNLVLVQNLYCFAKTSGQDS